jgi:hypothetical protein
MGSSDMDNTGQDASAESSPVESQSQDQTSEELIEEQRKLRRLQLMMNMVFSVLSQDPNLTVDEAAEMVADSRRAALAMFPDKELAYDLIYKPRLQRLMRERFRIQ